MRYIFFIHPVYRGLVIILMMIAIPLFTSKKVSARPAEKLNINADVQYKLSDFDRDPKPVQSSTGTNLSQEYQLSIEGSLLRKGFLDASLGAKLSDKFREDDVDVESHVHYDYSRWLKLDALSTSETDEDIFFSGTVEPQSPIHTVTEKYDAQVSPGPSTTLQYILEDKEREDVLFGTVVDEKTTSETFRFMQDAGALTLSAEYRKTDFDDLLGARSNIDSEDFNAEVFYNPKDFLSLSAFFEDALDKDLNDATSLRSTNTRVEAGIKPLKEIEFQDRVELQKDKDTRTGENITNLSNEIIVDFTPIKAINLEGAYKKGDEDKERDSTDISSTIKEERIRLRLEPLSMISFQGGFEVSDKKSTSETENLKNTKYFTDMTLEPIHNLRLSGNFSNTKQDNTFAGTTESDATSCGGSLQYRPKQYLSLLARFDTMDTDNPSTGAFTKTDTISSSINLDPTNYLNISLRTSSQKISGSSESAKSKRLLNALSINLDVLENLTLSGEYELIASEGSNASDEKMYDLATAYNIGRFDFTLRYQDREVKGTSPTDKVTILSNIKYRFRKNAVLSLKFSFTDYDDITAPANSYESTLAESIMSLRF